MHYALRPLQLRSGTTLTPNLVKAWPTRPPVPLAPCPTYNALEPSRKTQGNQGVCGRWITVRRYDSKTSSAAMTDHPGRRPSRSQSHPRYPQLRKASVKQATSTSTNCQTAEDARSIHRSRRTSRPPSVATTLQIPSQLQRAIMHHVPLSFLNKPGSAAESHIAIREAVVTFTWASGRRWQRAQTSLIISQPQQWLVFQPIPCL